MPNRDHLALAWAEENMSRREALLWRSLAAAEVLGVSLAVVGLVTVVRWCLR